MLTKEIIEVFAANRRKGDYQEIIETLHSKGVFESRGKPFTIGFVKSVALGNNKSHPIIEEAIVEFYAPRVEKTREYERRVLPEPARRALAA